MLRAAFLLSFTPLMLAGCNSLPEAAARETAIGAATPWPRLLTQSELAASLPAPPVRGAGGQAVENATERELRARTAALQARAAALRNRRID